MEKNENTQYKPKVETLNDLNRKLKRKEAQAIEAKEKGMNTSYGLLLSEIANINSKIRKLQTGGN